MKKTINKKLTLVKQTITNLNENGMNNAKGGVQPSEYPACAHTHDYNGRCVVLKVPMANSFQEC